MFSVCLKPLNLQNTQLKDAKTHSWPNPHLTCLHENFSRTTARFSVEQLYLLLKWTFGASLQRRFYMNSYKPRYHVQICCESYWNAHAYCMYVRLHTLTAPPGCSHQPLTVLPLEEKRCEAFSSCTVCLSDVSGCGGIPEIPRDPTQMLQAWDVFILM